MKIWKDIPLPIISLLRGDEDDVEGVNTIKTTRREGSESEKKIIRLGNLIYYFNLLCIENFFVRKLWNAFLGSQNSSLLLTLEMGA